ncbi:DUF6585 family protein [Nocardia mexicana]|uniref:Uncharacterized protein n=1 Tax=Nocardia mexicana TaxID=279262 RepID=A0A370GQY7_9NOCA|nr:DUF6585 family protein [Nocardia mexicana]RDI46135.1 hypothetical protein DFR68_11236 [Nocardia mexicana]
MTTAEDPAPAAAIGAAAERERLGRHRETYREAARGSRRYVVEAAVTTAGFAAAIAGFSMGWQMLGILGVTTVLMCGVRLLAGLGLLGWVSARNRGMRLDLYEHGLVMVFRGQVRVVRYDSTTLRRRIVRMVENPAPDQISYAYTVVDVAGVPITLRQGIENPQEWGARIERGVTEAQLPRAREALHAGECVDFEYFRLSGNGISVRKRSIPWARVSEIAVVSGWLSVRVVGQSQPLESLPISEIPNYAVFRALADELWSPADV